MENRFITVEFDENSLGFAVDLFCLLEKLVAMFDKASPELYGYVCAFGRDAGEDSLIAMSRFFSSELWDTGMWCDASMREILKPFALFDEALEGPDYPEFVQGYGRLKSAVLPARETLPENENDNSEKICQYLKQGSWRSTMIVGAESIGKRRGLYRYCSGGMKDFPPVIVRFGYANAVTCTADAFSPVIKKILPEDAAARLEEMAEVFFRERLREETSPFLIRRCTEFFALFLEQYKKASDKARSPALIVLENVHLAGAESREIILGACASLPFRDKLYFYGTSTEMKSVKPWEELFPRVIKFSPEKKKAPVENSPPNLEGIPLVLCEMAFACALFSRYFPPPLVSRLFEEEHKNPLMVEKTFAMLASFDLINSPSDPSPRFPELAALAAGILGERAETIRGIVRNRLLDWVALGRLKPCYSLLEALFSLGGAADEELMLRALDNDVMNGTIRRIEDAVENGTFADVSGARNAVPLLFIYRAGKVLNWGSHDEVRDFFSEDAPSLEAVHSELRARIIACQVAYNLEICDAASATTQIKEAMIITQGENGGRFLARVYRLFSLIVFSKQQLSEAIDYFDFAADEAEKIEDMGELALIRFYAAEAHFIFGNISKAERLALQAEEAALASGQADWADRAWFLRGRFRFEAGAYQEAMDIFRALESGHYGKGAGDFQATLAAWMYRVNNYLHAPPLSHKGGFDAKLFELEGAFLSGDYPKTLKLVSASKETLSKDRFLHIEQPDWRSGFAQCELLLFPFHDLWERMFITYQALALCHIDGAGQGLLDESVREMRRVIRDELPDTDPNDAFYFYSCYRVLKRSGASEVDMNTTISLAFKRLQRRASRIDDNETKRAFLSLNYWNGALEAAAREHKLI